MMLKKSSLSLAAALLFTCASASPIWAQNRQVIANTSDLPPVVIELSAKPSVLILEGGPGFDAIVEHVKSYSQDVLDRYEIRDPAAERQMLNMLVLAAHAEERWNDILALSERIQALETKPAARAMSGLLPRAYARAALASGGDDSPTFADRFESELSHAVAALDWDVVQDNLQALRGQYQMLNRNVIVGGLQGSLDTNAEAQQMKVSAATGSSMLGSRATLFQLLPLKDRIFTVLDRRVQSERAEKEDRWTERLVTLQQDQIRAPVTIAIWDTGMDPAVLADNLWTNPNEQENGRDDDGNGFIDDIHGIAYDPDLQRSVGALRPVPPEVEQNLQDLLRFFIGNYDQRAALDSPEAAAYREHMASLQPDQVLPFSMQMSHIFGYLHGTTTAYTAAEGNPGARVMGVRFDYRVRSVPAPVDEQRAEATEPYIEDVVNYMRENGVRVVNMSWGYSETDIANMLASVEPDPDRRRDRAKAVFDRITGAFVRAFQSAPEILFVAAAGNSDESVDFVRSYPAGINLPNVITVGAVDVALQPASFTSYGRSTELYANGFEVPSRVPGGLPIRISGTSLSAPYVTNLAAKLLAVRPELSVAEVRAIIEETATSEGERGLKVINPAAALARVTAAS